MMLLLNNNFDNFMQSQKAKYFQALLSQNSSKSKEISSDRINKRLRQITSEVGIFANPQSIKKHNIENDSQLSSNKGNLNEIKLKTQQINLNKSIVRQKQKVNNKKRMMVQELSSIKRAKVSNSLRLKNVSNTLQKLKLQKQIAYTIRRQQQLTKLIQQQQNREKDQQKSEEERQKSIERKRRMIGQKLRKISQQKQKRLELLSVKSSPIIPRYKLIQKQFMMQQIKRQIQKNMQIKRHKQLKLLKYAESIDKGLKLHKNIPSINRSNVKTESNEKHHILKERQEMIQQFEQKRKQIKININQQARHHLQIQKDKLLNPYKYNYLRLKQLSDQQIYTQFKDFQLQIDRNALGKQYFQQSKLRLQKHVKDRVNISAIKSEKQPAPKISTDRSQSENYQQRKKRVKTLPNSSLPSFKQDKISQILRENQSKSKIIELLQGQMTKTKKNMDGKIPQFAKSKPYEDFLKLQANVDNDYLTFLKTKIVSLQVHLQN